MQTAVLPTSSTAVPAEGSVADVRPLPRWLTAIDSLVIAILNVMLAVEVVLVFTSTMQRAFTHSSSMMWVDEISPLFLITLAFMGGAVAYGHGQFIAIRVVLDRLPASAQRYLNAAAEWTAIVVSVLIGGYSVPMFIANAEEKTILLGIPYLWMTLPITAGCALFIARAAHSLWRMPLRATASSGVAIGVLSAAIVSATPYLTNHSDALYATLAVGFLAMIASGVPVGFVLAVIGIVCVKASGSGDLMGVVMNAQRGAGGFVFLALPFFILAGFIMDRADVGARIVAFVSSLIGHIRGGLLQVMVVGVYVASCISGSKAADMATIGLPMNRKLEEHGYPPEERAAILAASAAMAESVPPSIALILMGSATAISTGALFIAGILPAALIGLMLMVTVRFRAKRAGWKATPRASAGEIAKAGRKAILPLLIPVILLGGIIGGIGTPTEVSTFAVLYSVALGLGYRKIDGRTLWSCMRSATLLNGMIFYTVSAATVFSWALTLEGVTTAIASTIAGLGHYGFLPAVIAITVLMGTMLESFVTILILGPLLLPVAQQLGIHTLQYGIVMTEAFGIGIILPPIGIALYVACAISGAKVEKASAPLLYYLPVLLAGLLLVVLFPTITTTLPRLLDFKH